MSDTSRRDLLRLSGGALWVGLASACGAAARGAAPAASGAGAAAAAGAGQGAGQAGSGFLMFQITDTHWGYKGPANPNPTAAFERSVAEIAG